MRHLSQPRDRKSTQGYGFLSFAKKLGSNYSEKIMETATDAVKSASKRVVQKTTEANGDLIGNKIADRITTVGKKLTIRPQKSNEINETT